MLSLKNLLVLIRNNVVTKNYKSFRLSTFLPSMIMLTTHISIPVFKTWLSLLGNLTPPPPPYLLILMLSVTLSRRKPLESIRDLGSWFDVHMRMDVHIGKICTTEDLSWTLQYQKGQKILSVQSSKTLVHRLLYLCILTNYCNSHLFGLTNYQLDHL